jgi:hypothetical protein
MTLKHSRTGVFSRIGESLYRHASSGLDYALNRNEGKLNVAGVLMATYADK